MEIKRTRKHIRKKRDKEAITFKRKKQQVIISSKIKEQINDIITYTTNKKITIGGRNMLLTYNVINLHLTEICNYRCSYCFAKFNVQNELGIDAWKQVVDQIKNYFDLNAIKDGRINLAGGEPLLLNYLDKLIDYIHSSNIKVSIITNASLLSKEKNRSMDRQNRHTRNKYRFFET